jgi:8-oxo-dGTP pyrophosphatase MutT (NUDIX family)
VLDGLLTRYQAAGPDEAADLERMRRLAAAAGDPWARSRPLHFTASALVVHPPSRRVLLRWHARHQRWLQVGGHGDPGESDPLAIALREAREETGLTDLVPWPSADLLHAVMCHVPASVAEPEHEHADLRFVLATEYPEAIVAENEQAPLRWLSLDEARILAGGNNVSDTLDRLGSVSFSLRLPLVTVALMSPARQFATLITVMLRKSSGAGVAVPQSPRWLAGVQSLLYGTLLASQATVPSVPTCVLSHALGRRSILSSAYR